MRPRNDLGRDFLFDNMWMNGFRLFVEREEETDFLMAMFPSLFSFLLTTEIGGGMSATKWCMWGRVDCSCDRGVFAMWSASSFPLMSLCPGTQQSVIL